MTRYTKNANGHYLIHGHKYEMLEGSRAQVMHGTAFKTSGGLKKPDLLQNKCGRIVSRKKHGTAKRENRLVKAGYGTKKGHFGVVKLGSHSRSRRSKKMRGGFSSGNNMSPSDFGDGSGSDASGPASVSHTGGRRGRGRGRSGRKGGAPDMTAMIATLSKGLTGATTTAANSITAPMKALVSPPTSQKAGRKHRKHRR
jgi:hypothetical protein